MRRITLRTVLLILAAEAVAGIVFVMIVALLYAQFSNTDSDLTVITATPVTPDPVTAPVTEAPPLTVALVTTDLSGQYAFPIAADPADYAWTHFHWDGINAVDIEARFGLSQTEFEQATAVELVAITNGIAVNYSGSVGGQGYMLHGDDGIDYYYAHMSQQWVPDGERVTVGQPLGIMGNTGNTAQFIEPHLHLAIGPRDSLWEAMPSINAAEWLRDKFGLTWEERPDAEILPDTPGGWPVRHPDLAIITSFAQAQQQGLPQPALELGFPGAAPTEALDIIATLSGEINVIRWTSEYGTRIQINNDLTLSTVVISGIDEWLVTDGAIVNKGQVIGRWNPANHPRLNYMIYADSELTDPAPTLGQSN